LKRMEKTIDKLQMAILEKVGSYGRGLESIKKEMIMMQDSFGKMVNPLSELAERKHHSQASHENPSYQEHIQHKKKGSRKK